MLQICDRCLNNSCDKEHAVKIDSYCEICGQIKDCIFCEHRLLYLHPYLPLLTTALDNNPVKFYCQGHGNESSPFPAKDHYLWLWQRRRRLRERDDVAYANEIEMLQEEMDNIWWNLSKEDKDAIKSDGTIPYRKKPTGG